MTEGLGMMMKSWWGDLVLCLWWGRPIPSVRSGSEASDGHVGGKGSGVQCLCRRIG